MTNQPKRTRRTFPVTTTHFDPNAAPGLLPRNAPVATARKLRAVKYGYETASVSRVGGGQF